MEGKDERQWAKLVVYVLLERDGKILLGKRKGAFGSGHYSFPAGHIDKGETVMECAKRELFEETGISADDFEFICVRLLQDYEIDGVQADPYVAFLVAARNWEGEPRLMEPDKTEEWEWHSIDKIPEPIFPPVRMLAECVNDSVTFLD